MAAITSCKRAEVVEHGWDTLLAGLEDCHYRHLRHVPDILVLGVSSKRIGRAPVACAHRDGNVHSYALAGVHRVATRGLSADISNRRG